MFASITAGVGFFSLIAVLFFGPHEALVVRGDPFIGALFVHVDLLAKHANGR
jgi:hypothetical protein